MRDSYIFFDRDTAFQGEVNTDHLVLEGVIDGDVLASKDVYLKQGAIVQGEISTQNYKIEEGSVHQGRLRLDLNRERKEPAPEFLESPEPAHSANGKTNGTSHHQNGTHQSSSAFDSIYNSQKNNVQQEQPANNNNNEEENTQPQRLW